MKEGSDCAECALAGSEFHSLMPDGKKESMCVVLFERGIWKLWGCLLFGLEGAGRWLSAGISMRSFLILKIMQTLSIFLRCFSVGSSSLTNISVTLDVGLKLFRILLAESLCTTSSSSWSV